MARTLLQTPINKLKLSLVGSRVARAHRELVAELAQKGLRFRPYLWISDDWFCPDGAPGFAIPFYLLAPELVRLEQRMMGHCEGAGERELMKLMRHECAHALDNAFGLRRKRERQELFGKSKTKYPTSYIPDLNSTDYVEHLGDGYAQAHPDEDWAETFAVWLGAKDLARLKRRYKGTKALEKILYVDRLMNSLQGQRPSVSERWTCDHFRDLELTLAKYYRRKLRKRQHPPLFEASELQKLLPVGASGDRRVLYLGKKNLCHIVATKTATPLPIVVKVVRELDLTLRQSGLGFKSGARYTNEVIVDLLSKKTSQYLKEERNRIIM